MLVVDVQRWFHAFGDHAGPKRPRRGLVDPSLEGQLDVIRPADIQILANDFLEEHAPGLWPIQALGHGRLGLED